ncbi:hypothetical protein LX32DRAFT_639186 [Colletotrichum zoysiae]|uniref:Uncharacterized protein n=1 Tax=Colletotrichum zoysiae TaxID=1216348 RepID=A0AAD9HI51_9PEZI|nr:hypothetical protein LX32DRAFT_639186 [Colletotrichum zoysiae]
MPPFRVGNPHLFHPATGRKGGLEGGVASFSTAAGLKKKSKSAEIRSGTFWFYTAAGAGRGWARRISINISLGDWPMGWDGFDWETWLVGPHQPDLIMQRQAMEGEGRPRLAVGPTWQIKKPERLSKVSQDAEKNESPAGGMKTKRNDTNGDSKGISFEPILVSTVSTS